MSPREGTSWLRYGCFGCLGAIGALVLVAASLVAIAALMARSERMTSRELKPELPAEAPPVTAEAPPAEIPAGKPLRVVLDLHQAGFEIGRGEKLRVDAHYAEGAYELIEKTEQGAEGETVYRVTFQRTGWGLLTGLKELLGGNQPRVKIELPPDVPTALEIDLSSGALKGDLGGLWLTSAVVRGSQGAAKLGFDEPTKAPMERLEIDMSMAGLELGGVGNASPADLDLAVSMAGANVDLRGSWSRDARIKIDSRMAGTVVQLPEGVRLVGLDRGGPSVEPEREVGLPTLTFDVSKDKHGDLKFVD